MVISFHHCSNSKILGAGVNLMRRETLVGLPLPSQASYSCTLTLTSRSGSSYPNATLTDMPHNEGIDREYSMYALYPILKTPFRIREHADHGIGSRTRFRGRRSHLPSCAEIYRTAERFAADMPFAQYNLLKGWANYLISSTLYPNQCAPTHR